MTQREPVLGLAALALWGSLAACAPEHGTIGAILGQDGEGHLYVREVASGLAAEQVDVHAGDEILLIDGRDARAMSPSAVHDALGGTVGAKVRLTLVRDGRIVRVTLSRTAAPRGAAAAKTQSE